MLDSQRQIIKSISHKKSKSRFNGDISPVPNGQKLSNGSFYQKPEEIDFNKSWTIMNYEDYLNYRYVILYYNFSIIIH